MLVLEVDTVQDPPFIECWYVLCSTKLNYCTYNGPPVTFPGLGLIVAINSSSSSSGSKNQTQLKVTGEWDMRNLCEVIEQPVWETSNHRRGKTGTRSDNLNPGDTEWLSLTLFSLLLLRNMNTSLLRLFVWMFLIFPASSSKYWTHIFLLIIII